jgi:hypothetical protein
MGTTTSSTSTTQKGSQKTPVQSPKAKTVTKNTEPKENVPGISQAVINELSDEINNMLSFAVYNGITINTEINALVQNSNVDDLINAHNLLCKNVAPATPKSIEYTRRMHHEGSSKSVFNKIPLSRNLMILSLVFLVMFITTVMSPDVNNTSLDKGILGSNGFPLLLNLGYLAAVAGLGVLFYLLKDVSSSIKNGTLVPEDSISYMSQILLGIIAGLIMSEILSLYLKDPNEINLFNKSILALIGGFSSDAIFSILQGLINKIKGIFITPNPQ